MSGHEPYKKHAKSNSAIPMPVIDKKILEQSRENLRKVQNGSKRLERKSSSSSLTKAQVPLPTRRRSIGSEMETSSTNQNNPELTLAELEVYINDIADKARKLSQLCLISTVEEASKFSLKLVLFQFKEISSVLIEITDGLSNHVEVSGIYEASINLTHTEKVVETSLESLRTTGELPEFGEMLKQNLLNLLVALKKSSSDYALAIAKEPLPLVESVPGFRAELGKYSKPTIQNSINYRLSYSFSASASISKAKTIGEESKISYADYKLDHIDNDAIFYRKFFYQQKHRNYLGVDERYGPIAISVKLEQSKDNEDHDPRYRAIFRTKEGDLRSVFPVTSVLYSGMKSKPSWNDVIHTINPSVNQNCVKRIEDPKLESELLRFDEHRLGKSYKFGILYCKGNQKKEEEMFGNEHGSPEFNEFLNFLGTKIKLKGHQGYAGGLDKKHDTTGLESLFDVWRGMEVMFHVSTLLPYSTSPDDLQQIQRKRHIGNDIVMIIFMDGPGQWNPLTIRSQFLHIFIVVQRIPSKTKNVPRYRISSISNEDVPEFGPDIPKPNEFDQDDEFKHFLYAKMINGENAAYKAPKFKDPHIRARQGLVENLVETYSNAQALKTAQQSKTKPVEKNIKNDEGEFKAKELYISKQRQNLMNDIRRHSVIANTK